MFYVPGQFVYHPKGLSHKLISRFNSLLEATPTHTPTQKPHKIQSRRVKTMDVSIDRPKRSSLHSKNANRMQLPVIEDKRFLLKGSTAHQQPFKKISLRRLELQNKLGLQHSRVERDRFVQKRVSERTKSDYYSLLPWQYGEDHEVS